MKHPLAAEWTATKTAMGLPTALLMAMTMVLLPVAPSVSIVVAYAALLVLAGRNRFRLDHSFTWRGPGAWMMVLFLLHAVGMAWTENTGFGLFDLQIKSPLLFLPLLVLFTAPDQRRGSPLFAFIFTLSAVGMVITSTLAALARIGAGSALSPMQEIFSSYWSLVLHPSYFALFLSFAIAAWCLLPIHRWIRNATSLFILFTLCLGVVLCASKIGWMLLAPLLLSLLVLRWNDPFVRKALLGMVGFSLIGVVVLVSASPYARDRVAEMFRATSGGTHDPTAVTSSEVRRFTWATAMELTSRSPLLGTGTGDIKDELVALYTEHGYTGAAEKRLNAHDQFLQTAACLGIPALLLMLAMLFVPLFALRPRSALLALFLLLNALNWLVESMLEVQAGAVFFCVFAVLLQWKDDANDLRPTTVKST